MDPPSSSTKWERFAELLGDGIFNADSEAWCVQRKAAMAEMQWAVMKPVAQRS